MADIFDRYLQTLIDGYDDILSCLADLAQLRSLDTATGVQLDIIGEIVGQPRELIDTDLITYFAFSGYPTAGGFGDLGNRNEGGIFYNLGDPLAGNTLLNDEQYRMFIKAKILKNTTSATPEELLTFVSFVFGATSSNLIGEGDASYTLVIGRQLTPFERTLLTYVFRDGETGAGSYFVLKPVGVRVNFGEYVSDGFFGFQGTSGAKGFGDNPHIPEEGEQGYGMGYGLSYGKQGGGAPLPPTVGGGVFATLF